MLKNYRFGERGEARLGPQLFVAAIILVVIIAGIFAVDRRLDSLEDRLSYRSPMMNEPVSSSQPVALEGEGRAVYVPAYSHIFSHGGKPVLLETTLSIRNTDPNQSVAITSVRFFDTDGHLVRSFLLEGPITLGPFATVSFLVEDKDTTGGAGANFLVEWHGGGDTNPPVIQAVMVGRDGTHGMSFVTEGREIVR